MKEKLHDTNIDSNYGEMSKGVSKLTAGVPWQQFNVQQYIGATRVKYGEDRYKKNKFNQEASDSLPCDRQVPDTRNAR